MKKRIQISCILVIIAIVLSTGCTVNEDQNKKASNASKSVNEETIENDQNDLNIKKFIPNGNYKVNFNGSDNAPSLEYIKGNGTSFQTVGTTGKGPFVNVYSVKDNDLYQVYSSELAEQEINDLSNINYLDKSNTSKKIFTLNQPIKIGTRLGNKEVIEIGENLKLDDLILKGFYIKTWEKEKDDNNKIVKVCYFLEGLGCVRYEISINGSIIEHSTLLSFEKKSTAVN
jgi:hypothetical protein